MRYHWQDSESLIQEVDIRPLGKRMEGVVYAPVGADPAHMRKIATSLRASGLTALADVKDNQYILRVEKLDSPEPLLEALARAGAVKGEPQTELTEADNQKKGFVQSFKENTVRSAGYCYLLGDALMMAAGLARMKGLSGEARKGGVSELATGALWFVPNVGLVAFGKKNPEKQTGILMRRVKDYLDTQGVDIPAEDQLTIDHLARSDGPVARIMDFFYEHPTEINNAVEAVGGLTMMKAGYNQRPGLAKEGQRADPNYYKMAAGLCVFGGMGSSVVLKEKKKPLHQQAADAREAAGQGDTAHKGFLERKADWFLEKPLRIAGWGAFANNVLNIVGAQTWEKPRVKQFIENEYAPEKARLQSVMDATDPAKWRDKTSASEKLAELENKKIMANNYGLAANLNLGTAAAFMLANGLYSMASKDTNTDIKALGGLDQVYAMTAHVIAAQPQEHHGELVQRMAGFFSNQPDVGDTADNIAATLREKVRGMHQNPWTERIAATKAGQESSAHLSV